MPRSITIALAMATGAAFSQVLYARLLVPNLSQSHSVPTLVWLAVASPLWMTGLTTGMWLTSWREVALAAALAAIAFQTGETWAIGASILFWSVGVILTTGAVLTLLAAGRLIRLGAQSLKMI